MNERTNTPFKTLFFALSIIPLIIPGILFTVAWILLAAPRSESSTLRCKTGSGWRGPVQRLFAVGDDLGRRPALLADGLSPDDGRFPRDGSRARGVRDHERGEHLSGRVPGDLEAHLAGDPRDAADALRARDRVLRSARVLGLPVGIHVFTSAIYQAVHRYPSQIGLASRTG